MQKYPKKENSTAPMKFTSRSCDEIHQQILHRIDEADVQITAQPQRSPVDRHIPDILQADRRIAMGRVENDRGK